MCLMFITQEKMSNHVQFIAIVGEKIQYWAKQNRIIHLKFGTCRAELMKIQGFWEETPCWLLSLYYRLANLRV